MDVRMPGMDGLQATKVLTERLPETAVLIFTAYSERSLLGRGLESGAKGYILKEAPHQTLLRAIEKVAAGDGYVDPALMPAFLTGKDKDDMLTSREREILQLLSAEQDERRRLALYLHDTTVQSLSGIALMIDAALGSLDTGRVDEARSVMTKALDRHRDAIRELRRLSFNLEPIVLRDQGFG